MKQRRMVQLDVEPAINEQRCKCKVTIAQLTPKGVVRTKPVHDNELVNFRGRGGIKNQSEIISHRENKRNILHAVPNVDDGRRRAERHDIAN